MEDFGHVAARQSGGALKALLNALFTKVTPKTNETTRLAAKANRSTPKVTGSEGRKAFTVIDAAYRSAETGRIITLKD